MLFRSNIFEGDIVGKGIMKGFNSRSSTLSAIGYSEYWDDCKQYYVDPMKLGGIGSTSFNIAKSDGDPMFAKPVPFGNAVENFFQKAFNEAKEGEDFVYTIVNRIINQIANSYYIYRSADSKYDIASRIVAASAGKIEEILKGRMMKSIVNHYSGQQSGHVTVTQTIIHLLSLIFHQYMRVYVFL